MAEPRFSSLVLAAKEPELDVGAIERSPRLREVDPEHLLEEISERGRAFWNSLEFATDQIRRTGRLTDDFIDVEHAFLVNVEGLIPSAANYLDRVEITFNDGHNLRNALIDRHVGDQIVDAQDRLQRADVRTIVGMITEVNGDSGTFIIKNLAERQTTCNIPWETFEALDDSEDLVRGRQVSITGHFTRRARRDHIWSDQPIVFLN